MVRENDEVAPNQGVDEQEKVQSRLLVEVASADEECACLRGGVGDLEPGEHARSKIGHILEGILVP